MSWIVVILEGLCQCCSSSLYCLSWRNENLSQRRDTDTDTDTVGLLTIFSEVMLAVFLDVENKVEILKVEIGKI